MLMIDDYTENNVSINGKWYIAKPIPFKGLYGLWLRFKDSLKVFSGKGTAVYFAEDKIKIPQIGTTKGNTRR